VDERVAQVMAEGPPPVNGFLQQNGVISRNMGDAIAFCPPLIITEVQVDALVDAFERSLDAALPQILGRPLTRPAGSA